MANGMHVCPHTATIARIEKDMYYGNGKPGITTRMELTEKCIGDIKTIMEEQADRLKWGVRLLAGTFLSSIAAIIVALVLGHK